MKQLRDDVEKAIDYVIYLQRELKEIAIKSINKSKLDYIQEQIEKLEKKGKNENSSEIKHLKMLEHKELVKLNALGVIEGLYFELPDAENEEAKGVATQLKDREQKIKQEAEEAKKRQEEAEKAYEEAMG